MSDTSISAPARPSEPIGQLPSPTPLGPRARAALQWIIWLLALALIALASAQAAGWAPPRWVLIGGAVGGAIGTALRGGIYGPELGR